MERTTARRVVIVAAAVGVLLAFLFAVVHTSGASAAPEAVTQTTRRRSSTTTTIRRRSTLSTTVTSTAPATEPSTVASTAAPAAAPFVAPVAPGGTAPNGGPLLVPGASDPPASTAADVAHTDNTGTIVALVIAGLLVVALLLGLLTYWFWRNTRPRKAPVESRSERSEELAEAKVNDG